MSQTHCVIKRAENNGWVDLLIKTTRSTTTAAKRRTRCLLDGVNHSTDYGVCTRRDNVGLANKLQRAIQRKPSMLSKTFKLQWKAR